MSIGQTLSFSLHDEVDGRPLTPEHVDLLTLNVTAMEHIRMGELRELRHIDVVRSLKEIDQDKLKSLWQKGRVAWSEITSPTEWVERLRESRSMLKICVDNRGREYPHPLG